LERCSGGSAAAEPKQSNPEPMMQLGLIRFQSGGTLEVGDGIDSRSPG
jgi:hypothetical protein